MDSKRIPSLENAGNVLRDRIKIALSFRLPPGVDPDSAASTTIQTLENSPPYNALVSVEIDSSAIGWAAPKTQAWLYDAFEQSSQIYFGEAHQTMGEGGSIPFMAMLGKKYPDAQFMVTGVLGPESNAHGPNEFLDLPTAYKVTGCVAGVIQTHADRV